MNIEDETKQQLEERTILCNLVKYHYPEIGITPDEIPTPISYVDFNYFLAKSKYNRELFKYHTDLPLLRFAGVEIEKTGGTKEEIEKNKEIYFGFGTDMSNLFFRCRKEKKYLTNKLLFKFFDEKCFSLPEKDICMSEVPTRNTHVNQFMKYFRLIGFI